MSINPNSHPFFPTHLSGFLYLNPFITIPFIYQLNIDRQINIEFEIDHFTDTWENKKSTMTMPCHAA